MPFVPLNRRTYLLLAAGTMGPWMCLQYVKTDGKWTALWLGSLEGETLPALLSRDAGEGC